MKENNLSVNKHMKDSEDGIERKENNWFVKKYIKGSEDGRERKENNWSVNKEDIKVKYCEIVSLLS